MGPNTCQYVRHVLGVNILQNYILYFFCGFIVSAHLSCYLKLADLAIERKKLVSSQNPKLWIVGLAPSKRKL